MTLCWHLLMWWIKVNDVHGRHPSLSVTPRIVMVCKQIGASWRSLNSIETCWSAISCLDYDAIQDCTSTSILMLNQHKCNIELFKKDVLPPTSIGTPILASVTLEQVESYCYLAVFVWSRLTWSDHTEQNYVVRPESLECCMDSFIAGPTPIPCSLSIASAYNLTWNMPGNSSSPSQIRASSHWNPERKSVSSSGTLKMIVGCSCLITPTHLSVCHN